MTSLHKGSRLSPADRSDSFSIFVSTTSPSDYERWLLTFPAPLDPGCRFIILTPVADTGCGENRIIARSATCAPIDVDTRFTLSFCCGTGDCGAAGARTSSANVFGDSVTAVQLVDRDGKPLGQPRYAEDTPTVSSRSIEKRCDSFTPDGFTYTRSGNRRRVSPDVTCAPGVTCQAQMSESITETFGLDVGLEVSDPFDIISASVNINWEQSITREFSASFDMPEGGTGFVGFTPILT